MIWILLIVFQLKHFIADYLLQGKYMLGKFKSTGWALPLTSHCTVHFIFTTTIALMFVSLGKALLLGLLDFILHFIMDRIKASPNLLGKYQVLSKSEMKRLLAFENKDGDIDGLRPTKYGVESSIKSNVLFWWSLGLDQMVHHLTDILTIYLILEVL